MLFLTKKCPLKKLILHGEGQTFPTAAEFISQIAEKSCYERATHQSSAAIIEINWCSQRYLEKS
jgi:hypothetical protein